MRRSVKGHCLIACLLAVTGCGGRTLAVIGAYDENGERRRVLSDSTPTGRFEARLLTAALDMAKSGGAPRPHTEALGDIADGHGRYRARFYSSGGGERVFMLTTGWLVEERAEAILAWRGDMREAVGIMELILAPSRLR